MLVALATLVTLSAAVVPAMETINRIREDRNRPLTLFGRPVK
jgi:hypothetical protein